MAVKTITIDLEAYETLSRHKKPGQSFSQVIKEQLARPKTGRDLLAATSAAEVSETTLDAVDELIERRSESPASAAIL